MSLSSQVSVQVAPKYIAEQSDPDNDRFVFAYTITITNNSEQQVQLISRRWLITDANAKVVEVEGSGVVGEQPILRPGAAYTYTSGAIIDTAVGTMEGQYNMQDANQAPFDVPIPVFRLAMPNIVH